MYTHCTVQWGMPTFSVGVFVGLVGSTLASIIESIGDYYGTAKVAQLPPPPKHAVNRGKCVCVCVCVRACVHVCARTGKMWCLLIILFDHIMWLTSMGIQEPAVTLLWNRMFLLLSLILTRSGSAGLQYNSCYSTTIIIYLAMLYNIYQFKKLHLLVIIKFM